MTGEKSERKKPWNNLSFHLFSLSELSLSFSFLSFFPFIMIFKYCLLHCLLLYLPLLLPLASSNAIDVINQNCSWPTLLTYSPFLIGASIQWFYFYPGLNILSMFSLGPPSIQMTWTYINLISVFSSKIRWTRKTDFNGWIAEIFKLYVQIM